MCPSPQKKPTSKSTVGSTGSESGSRRSLLSRAGRALKCAATALPVVQSISRRLDWRSSQSCASRSNSIVPISYSLLSSCHSIELRNIVARTNIAIQDVFETVASCCAWFFEREGSSMTAAENPPPSNFRRLVLGCIEAKFCK